MNPASRTGRLSTLAAAYIIARRDFTAILFSRSFVFFLLGPLFTIAIGGLAGGIGQQTKISAERPELGLAMNAADVDAMIDAQRVLAAQIGPAMPDTVVVRRLAPGEQFDPVAAMKSNRTNLAAIVTGSPQHPVLTGPRGRIEDWQGRVALMGAQAAGNGPDGFPQVALSGIATSRADQNQSRMLTAQMGQVVLLLLTMLLAGMVLSNLVEEKGNKIIEVLAAAIPMDAVFLGKLFAMLAVSFVGIAVWGTAGLGVSLAVGKTLPAFAAPAVGWTAFLLLGVAYFSMGYLLIGAVFLAIGSMAATVRDVQTLSLPATLLQLVVFFIASFAVTRPGSVMELAAIAFPFSSPFAMLARAAQDPRLWIHGVAIAWQLLAVALLIRAGASLFRRRVMMSGPATARKRGLFRRFARPAAV